MTFRTGEAQAGDRHPTGVGRRTRHRVRRVERRSCPRPRRHRRAPSSAVRHRPRRRVGIDRGVRRQSWGGPHGDGARWGGRCSRRIANLTDFLRSHSRGASTRSRRPVFVGRTQQLWAVEISRATDGRLVAVSVGSRTARRCRPISLSRPGRPRRRPLGKSAGAGDGATRRTSRRRRPPRRRASRGAMPDRNTRCDSSRMRSAYARPSGSVSATVRASLTLFWTRPTRSAGRSPSDEPITDPYRLAMIEPSTAMPSAPPICRVVSFIAEPMPARSSGSRP